MPKAAGLFAQSVVTAANATPLWSGELHGEIGAMHRTIEQRLSAGSFELAVIPLPARPIEDMLAQLSRAAGWTVLAGAFTALGTVAMLLR